MNETVVKAIVGSIALIAYTLLGAWDIGSAVRHYKAERYFLFGLDIMFACLMLVLIVRLYYR